MSFDFKAAVWTAAVKFWDAIAGAETTVNFASSPKFTVGGATPSSAGFELGLLQPSFASRTAFDNHRTMGKGRASVGNTVVANPSGRLDYLRRMPVDGRGVTVYHLQEGQEWNTDKVVTLDSSMESSFFKEPASPEGKPTIEFVLRDWTRPLEVPLSSVLGLYAGNNTPPAGLEGTADLAGKAKPFVTGAPRNFEMLCVNPDKFIYQASATKLSSIGMVYDGGLPLASTIQSWDSRTPTGLGTVNGVAVGENGTMVVAGVPGSGGSIAYSLDNGATFTNIGASGAGTYTWNNVRRLNGYYVAVGTASGFCGLATSPDGITWTVQIPSGAGVAGQYYDCAYGAGKWVAVGYDPSPANFTSNASATSINSWSHTTTIAIGYAVTCVVFFAGLFIVTGGDTNAGGGNGFCYTSPDYVNWTLRPSGGLSLEPNTGLVVAGGVVLSFTSGGSTIRSFDGQTWTNGPKPTTASWSKPAYGAGNLLAGTTNGQLWSSGDLGVSWLRITFGNFSDIEAVAFNEQAANIWLLGGGTTHAATSGLSGAAYANSTDLQDDTLKPVPGTYKVFLDNAGSYVRLGAKPKGRVTCDPVGGAAGNQALHSEEFDDAYWTKNSVTVAANATTAPDGTMTADKVTSTVTSGNPYVERQFASWGFTSCTASIHVKQGSGARKGLCWIAIFDITAVLGLNNVQIDLATGQVLGVGGTDPFSVQDAGNGWWRIVMVQTGLTVGHTIALHMGVGSFGGATWNNTEFSYVWGAQLDPASTATQYTKTTTATAVVPMNVAGAVNQLLTLASYTSRLNAASLTALGTLVQAPIGYGTWQGDTLTFAALIDFLLASAGCWWTSSGAGQLIFGRLDVPFTNAVANPDALATAPWVNGGGTTTATNAVATAGRSERHSFSRINSASSGQWTQPVTVKGTGTVVLRFRIRQNSTDTGVASLGVFDSTASAWRARVSCTIATGGAITAVATTGTLIGIVAEEDGVYSVAVSGTGVDITHPHVVYAADTGPTTAASYQVADVQVYDGAPALTINELDLAGLESAESADDDKGIPCNQVVVKYSRNYTPMAGTDILLGVSDARRALLMGEWLNVATSVDSSVTAAYSLSQALVVETLFVNVADANAEATRLKALKGVYRSWIDPTLFLDDSTLALEVGNLIDLVSTRLGLGAGARRVLLSVNPDLGGDALKTSTWG